MGDSSDSSCPFLELPTELLDKIVLYLDANALSNLKKASKKTRGIIGSIASSVKGEQVYEDACQPHLACTSSSVLKSIIASYLTELDESARAKSLEELKLFRSNPKITASLGIWRPSEVVEPCVNWEEAFERHTKYLGKISYPQMRLEHMKDMERILKDTFQIFYGLYWTDAVVETEKKWPMQFISTCGPTLYHFMGPVKNTNNPDSLTFYENMAESRRSTLRLQAADTVYSCKLVMLNFHWDSAMVRPILVLQMNPPGLWLCPVNEGRPLKISLPFVNPEYPTQVWHPNPYAFCGNYLAVFENPLNLRVYLINMDVAGNLVNHGEANGYTSVPEELPPVWSLIHSARDAYCFALTQELAFPSVIGRHPQSKVYGERAQFFYWFIFAGRTISFDGTRPYFRNFEPKIHGGTWDEMMKSPKFEYDHSTILAWNANAFACPFGFHNWAASTWSKHIRDIKSVSLVEIIDNHTVMLCAKPDYELECGLVSRIVLGKIVLQNDVEGERGSVAVSLEIIRIITLEPELFTRAVPSIITGFHFDFDCGRPYIFLVAEQNSCDWRNRAFSFSKGNGSLNMVPNSAYISLTFQLMKIAFQDFEGDLANSSKIVHDFDPSAAPPPVDDSENVNAKFPDEMLANLLECLARFDQH